MPFLDFACLGFHLFLVLPCLWLSKYLALLVLWLPFSQGRAGRAGGVGLCYRSGFFDNFTTLSLGMFWLCTRLSFDYSSLQSHTNEAYESHSLYWNTCLGTMNWVQHHNMVRTLHRRLTRLAWLAISVDLLTCPITSTDLTVPTDCRNYNIPDNNNKTQNSSLTWDNHNQICLMRGNNGKLAKYKRFTQCTHFAIHS